MRPRLEHLLLVAVVLGSVLVSADPAAAHRQKESYLYLDVGDDDLRGNLHLPFTDLSEVFGLRLEGTPEEVENEIASNLETIQAYAIEHTSIGADGVAWPLTFVGYNSFNDFAASDDGFGFVVLPFLVDLPDDVVPQVIDVTFTPFVDEIPDRKNLVLVANDWQRGVIGEEANTLVVLDASSRSAELDLGDSSQWKNFDASIELGIDHIRTGPDHIFFILALLLPSVLILAGGTWRPAPRFRTAFVRILVVATMFTLAHSITFTLAGLDLVPLPPAKLTETLIAVSIAVAALHNLRPVLGHREWAIAFVFGLFHGLGFAGFVEDLEVNRTTQLVSLLGRNLGIEIGQGVIVVIAFPALFLLSRTRFYKPLFTTATIVLAAVSTVWVFERLLDDDYGINDRIDRVVEWPRALVVCVLVTAAVAALVWWERVNGRLLTDQRADAEPPAPSDPEPVAVG